VVDQPRAECRDVVQVTEEGHRRHGERFLVISGNAGIGSAFIHACAEDNHLDRTGLRHDQVAVVGRAPADARVPLL
jgi:hypothetical protein